MKTTTLLALLCLSTALPAQETSKIPSLTTTDGRTYTAVTITKMEPDGIRIAHESGTAKIPFTKLPEALQKQHGYDPAKARSSNRKRTPRSPPRNPQSTRS